MKARSRLSSAFRQRHHKAQAEVERSNPSNIVQGSVERSFGWLVHWGGLLRDRAGRLDVSAARIAFAAALSGIEALLNPMPTEAAAS